MSARYIEGEASASPAACSVVALPTAAPRKVRQNHNRKSRSARESLAQHPAAHLWPEERRAEMDAEHILFADHRAALRLAVAMFRVLDERQRRLMELYLAVEAETSESESAAQALSFIRLECGDIAHKHLVTRAIDRLSKRAAL